MSEPTLFDMNPTPLPEAEPVEKLSEGRRRTIRQRAALERGRHPIGLCFGFTLRLHPDAPPAADREAPGPRCGTCAFRSVVGHGNRSYAKCMRAGGRFDTNGAASDLRGWWPACEHWQEKAA